MQLDRATVGVSPLEACIVILDTMRTSPQEVELQVSFTSSPPNPMSEVCIVFNSRVLS